MVLKIGGFHEAARGLAAWSCPNTAYDGSERSRRPTSCSYIAVTSRISSKSRIASRWSRPQRPSRRDHRSEEHTSELQSLMRISYAVFCLKKKNNTKDT